MIKRFIPAAAAALVLATAAGGASAQAAQRVAFVNSQRVLEESPMVQQAQTTLRTELQALQSPLQQLEQQLEQGQQQLQQQGSTLSEQARNERQQALQQQFLQYQQRSQQAQQQAERRQAELLQPVMNAINAAIEAERAAGGFTYVIDSSANGIVAVDPAVDLTTRVIARLGRGPQR